MHCTYSYYSSLYQLVASKYYFFLQLQYLFLLAYQHSASNPIGLLLSVPTGLSAFSLVSCLFTHVCSCWLTKIQPRILFVYSCLLLLAYQHSASNPIAILLLFYQHSASNPVTFAKWYIYNSTYRPPAWDLAGWPRSVSACRPAAGCSPS